MGETVKAEDGFANVASGLQSNEHSQLLDVIDHLRALGIDHHVPLPQLVVCGDQSSGKSSVLEAVSGVRFPTKDTLCTRFATELILRRSVSSSVDIKIRPSQDRSDEDKARLSAFKAPNDDVNQFPLLVETAKEFIGIDAQNRFSEDVLRVEVSGPKQTHLTLVDLPGLFHSGNKQQSSDEAALVKSLVQQYMKNERSIILAVVSAKNDYANQIVTDLARKFDPQGLRTMGIVTKPDTLDPGSESETSFLNLVKNEDVAFRLGWHVLRNRDFHTKEYSSAQRDRDEKIFFSKGVWTSLPVDLVGIDSLKPRLTSVLKDQIISVLPGLLEDVEREIEECILRLSRLGDERKTLLQQRQYLIRVSQRFSALVKAAVDGVYGDEYFGDPMTPEGEGKRLRAVIQDTLLNFAEEMCRYGHQRKIVDDGIETIDETGGNINRSKYLDHVRELMRRTRGRELPGTFNPLIIGDLFFEQSRPWKALIDACCHRILENIRTFLESTVDATTDSISAEGLLQRVLHPALETRTASLRAKVSEILEPYQRGHAITYNHYFTDTIQKARREHEEKDQAQRVGAFFGVPVGTASVRVNQTVDIPELVRSLGASTQADMDRYACSEATHCMQAYYKVALKVLVDNFSILAVERCLLMDLASILSPDVVMKLDENVVEAIATEPESFGVERQRATDKLRTMREGLMTLNQFNSLKTRRGGETEDHVVALARSRTPSDTSLEDQQGEKIDEVLLAAENTPVIVTEEPIEVPDIASQKEEEVEVNAAPLVRRFDRRFRREKNRKSSEGSSFSFESTVK